MTEEETGMTEEETGMTEEETGMTKWQCRGRPCVCPP